MQEDESIHLPRTAVLVDGDWLIHIARQCNIQISYPEFKQQLERFLGDKTEFHFFLSVRSAGGLHDTFVQCLSSAGYATHVFELGNRDLDMELTTMAIGLGPEYDRVLLISGDNDFAPMLDSIRRAGKTPILVALEKIAGRALLNSAAFFVDLARISNTQQDSAGTEQPTDLYIERGDYFGSYRVLRKLLIEAKSEVVFVDSYIDEQLLVMCNIVDQGVSVEVITARLGPPDLCIMVNKLRREGRNIEILKSSDFHDRFMKIDNKWWHSGHSFKDLGSRDSRLSLITDLVVIKKVEERLEEARRLGERICGAT